MRRGSRSNNGFVGLNLKHDSNSGIVGSNKDFSVKSQDSWFRPSNWLAMPDMTAGDQRIALIAAVAGPTGATIGASSLFALSVSGCTYTVDWGNGFTQSYPSNSVASYGLYYDELPPSTTVKPGTENNFGMRGSTAFDQLNGYRQALVQVYPTFAGTTFDGFNPSPSTINIGDNARFPNLSYRRNTILPDWISCKVSSPTIRSMSFGSVGPNLDGLQTLKEVEIVGTTGITNGSRMFQRCYDLKKVSGTEWCRNITNFSNMFEFCHSLKSVPLLNTSSATTVSSMFSLCSDLQTVPQFDTQNVTNFIGMFGECENLNSVPLFNTKNAINLGNMFRGCSSLESCPLFDTQNVEVFGGMFACELTTLNPSSLKTVPNFNYSKGRDFASMFFGCRLLKTIDMSSAVFNQDTSVNFLFGQCENLKSIKLPNTNLITNGTGMFYGCSSLESLSLDLSSCTNISNMFAFCSGMRDLNLTMNSATNLVITDGFTGMSSNLQRIRLNGIRQGPLRFGGVTSLSVAALNELYESLGTNSATLLRSIIVTPNWGASGSSRSIAGNKNWIVI